MIEFVKNFWCHKVLPLVYTDALSYYETLGKLIQKINEVITNVNSVNENAVFTVNNIKPTGGNVDVGTVKSVNGSVPDEAGNINLPSVSGVTSVDGISADASGNVQLNAVKTVNGITPTGGNVNVGTVKSVNNKTPDSNGNVDAGTVKSVNSSTPDSSGNVNVGTIRKINNLSPNDDGSISLSATNVDAIEDGSTYGQLTANAQYFKNSNILWYKRGQLVTVYFYGEAVTSAGEATVFATGLPRCFGQSALIMHGNDNNIVGATVDASGNLKFAYYNATVTNISYIGYMAYITSE